MTLPIGLQLYTVRDELARDFRKTLEQVAAMGYTHIELFDLCAREAEEIRQMCDEVRLTIISRMISPDELVQDDVAWIIEEAAILGNPFIVCPYLPEEWRNESGYTRLAAGLDCAGQELRQAGLTLCYHNHSFEFKPLEGPLVGFDLLYGQTAPENLKAELDVYWLQHGGRDPLTTLETFSGRVPLLHIKDMASDADRGFTEVGTGIIDIQGLINRAPSCGVECLIVEQDANWKGSPMESAAQSYHNLRRILNDSCDYQATAH